MRLVTVSRLLNEDDIVEAFVRHHATFADHMLFLDNGSNDRTLEILRALHDEGLPLSVFQARAVMFDEVQVNSWLYETADGIHRPDWVAFLDVDEFIVCENGDLAGPLDALPASRPAVMVPLVQYFDTMEDDAAEPVVPKRMQWRTQAEPDICKVFVRGGFGRRARIGAGNHTAWLDGGAMPMDRVPGLALAHYPRRSGWHDLQKSTVGWFKVLATGAEAIANRYSQHYQPPFERLRDEPGSLLHNPGYLSQPVERERMVRDPIDYRGSALRHTVSPDPAMRALSNALHHAEALARAHGRLLDESAEARALVARWNAERKFLF